jgi:hypothetical protein
MNNLHPLGPAITTVNYRATIISKSLQQRTSGPLYQITVQPLEKKTRREDTRLTKEQLRTNFLNFQRVLQTSLEFKIVDNRCLH